MDDLCRPDQDLSRPRAGDLARWVRWLMVGAAVLTVVIALVVPRLFLEAEGMHAPKVLELGLAGVVMIALVWAIAVQSPVSVGARVAVVLPLTHLVLVTAVAIAWVAFGSRLEIAHSLVPLADALPLGAIVGAVGAATIISAVVIARRRRREVIQVAVMIALVQLLALGAWLPFASSFGVDAFDFAKNWIRPAALFETFHRPVALAMFALVPPLAISIGYATIATRRTRWLAEIRAPMVMLLGVALLFGCGLRSSANATALTIYLNFMPWLLAVAFVAVAMIALLCGSYLVAAARHRRAIARDRRQFTGTIAGTDVVACVAVRSWLRGPEIVVDGFEITTPDGAVPVPPGAILAAPLPLASTALEVGEGLAALHGGTPVALAGFDRPADGSPFRRSLAPTASGSVVVGPAQRDADGGLAQIALAAWRPCVAYLLIFLAVAIPALAGMSSSGR